MIHTFQDYYNSSDSFSVKKGYKNGLFCQNEYLYVPNEYESIWTIYFSYSRDVKR